MTNPLIMKLAHGAALTDEDRALISQHTSGGRQVGPRQDLIHEGDRPENVHLVMEGLACRYKLLPDGSRQIMALLVPGDFCDLHIAILGEMDHNIATLSACRIVDVPQASIEAVTELSPRITRALWWATLVDEGILRAWLVNMGRRSADQQMAHLFCELLVRLEAAGLSTDGSFDLPITQEELGDTLGLSSVHVNRTLQHLRSERLIAFKLGRVVVLNRERLYATADFNPNYLHLTPRVEATTAHGRQPRSSSLG